MTRRTRLRLALLVLLVALPAYLAAAATLMGLFERPHWLLELALYVALGMVWVLPFRRLFLGLARSQEEGER